MVIPGLRTARTAEIELPVQFSRIRDIGYNLWWTWNADAAKLFDRIDAEGWRRYRNPIQLLINLEATRWHALQGDVDFIRAYRALVEQFDAYVAPHGPTWFERNFPDYDGGPIAYFSTEYGWHECLQIYSGGLGVLSGDHSKTASDMGLPFVGIGLMYRHGYFRQTVDADGHQQHFFPDYDLHRVPLESVVDKDGRELKLSLGFPGRRVYFRAWLANVGRAPVLLLDTDVEDNHPADRSITSVLYVSGREMRLCQEMVLGMGGVRLIEALGIEPAVWHMNEGHSALLSLERMRALVQRELVTPEQARERVAADTVFTTHTPVPAGNETFDEGLIRKYFESWSVRHSIPVETIVGLGRANGDPSFNLTALAIRTSSKHNGVSRRHGEVADAMWRHVLDPLGGRHVDAITNGVHVPTWIGPEVDELLQEALGEDWFDRLLDPAFPAAIERLPAPALWAAHRAQKLRLIERIRENTLRQLARHGRSPDELRELQHLLDPEVLLVGFARRFATYKRADLLLRDLDRLRAIVGSKERPIQFVFAGKAHPADRPGQDLIRRIWGASADAGLKGRLLFLENYDMHTARFLVQGVDVWLNNPRRPQEASGTSGMKAAINGGLNCSILDGWWCEGYDPSHGWVISEHDGETDHEAQDRNDSADMYRVLSDHVAPPFYDRGPDGVPHAWVERMKRAMALLTPRFSTARMLRDYVEQLYARTPATAARAGSASLAAGQRS